MAEAQKPTENTHPEQKDDAPTEQKNDAPTKEKSPWYTQPENLGNSAGSSIESSLSPVGNKVAGGINYVTAPVGGVVDGVAGGLMRSSEAVGETLGVGFGNKDGGPAKAAEREGERMKESIGGKEQTGENPLGL